MNEVPSPESYIATYDSFTSRAFEFDSITNSVTNYALPYYEYSGECSGAYYTSDLYVQDQDTGFSCSVCTVSHDTAAGTTTLGV